MTQSENEERMRQLEAEKIAEDRYRTSKGDEYETDGYYYRKSNERAYTDSRENKD